MREVADQHVHSATGERPIVRFARDEAQALRPLDGRAPFRAVRELVRRVQADATIELDTKSYSAPWRLIGATVAVTVAGGRVSIRCRGDEVASHGETTGRRQRVMDAARLAGIGRPRFAVSEPPAELALALAEPDEAVTSRPLLLAAIAARTRHARQTTIRATSAHAKSLLAAKALTAVAAFLRGPAKNAEQLTSLQIWRAILARAFKAFLGPRVAPTLVCLAPT